MKDYDEKTKEVIFDEGQAADRLKELMVEPILKLLEFVEKTIEAHLEIFKGMAEVRKEAVKQLPDFLENRVLDRRQANWRLFKSRSAIEEESWEEAVRDTEQMMELVLRADPSLEMLLRRMGNVLTTYSRLGRSLFRNAELRAKANSLMSLIEQLDNPDLSVRAHEILGGFFGEGLAEKEGLGGEEEGEGVRFQRGAKHFPLRGR